MNIRPMLLGIFLIAVGIFMVVFGGYDDSPGAQLIGLVAAGGGVITIGKNRKK